MIPAMALAGATPAPPTDPASPAAAVPQDGGSFAAVLEAPLVAALVLPEPDVPDAAALPDLAVPVPEEGEDPAPMAELVPALPVVTPVAEPMAASAAAPAGEAPEAADPPDRAAGVPSPTPAPLPDDAPSAPVLPPPVIVRVVEKTAGPAAPPPEAAPRWSGSAESALRMRAAFDASDVDTPLPDSGDAATGLAASLPFLSADPPARSASGSAPFAPALPLPLPPQTAPALVQAIMSAETGTVELVLTPEDLGRLRFEITQAGDQMRILLHVERPETLDLLRRHADQILAEFRQAGHAGASLSFAGGGGGAAGGQDRPAPQGAPAAPFVLQPAVAPPLAAAPGGGLDLRL